MPGSNPPVRRNFPCRQWVEGWEEAIFDFDQYSMRRFLREQAHLAEEAFQAIYALKNLIEIHGPWIEKFYMKGYDTPRAGRATTTGLGVRAG